MGGGAKEPILREALEALPATPDILIIPSACSTEKSYARKVGPTTDLFKRLGAHATVLHEFDSTPSHIERDEKFGRATLIYTIGGHTPTLMKTLQAHGTDNDISDAARNGTMLAGVSSGALLPFRIAHICPAKQPEVELWDYQTIAALGLLAAAATVHANQIDPTKIVSRLVDFTEHFSGLDEDYGFGVESGAAMFLCGGDSRVLRSRETAEVHVVSKVGNVATSRTIEDDLDFRFVLHCASLITSNL